MQEITNFEECVQAGNPVMMSYPAQCGTKEGKTFVQVISVPEVDNAPVPVPGSDVAEISTGMPVPGSTTPEMVVVPSDGDSVVSPSRVHDLPVPPAVDAARAYIIQKTGAVRSEVIVLEAFEREWPDACLGAAGLDGTLDLEVCAEVITPGYEIKINAKGKEYQLRTNSDGSLIREISVVDGEEMIVIK